MIIICYECFAGDLGRIYFLKVYDKEEMLQIVLIFLRICVIDRGERLKADFLYFWRGRAGG